ncbi:SlyX family protein [Bradyrhizobium elkanii]|uniref:SlyX family protein n=1 Tax=Bradyrhizobium elkanii TaxID=29448 RepID=UPI002FEFF159
MNDTAKLSERIDALEVRLTYQDETIETLNQTITAQWKQIDALTRQIAELRDRLQEAERQAPGPPTSAHRTIDRRRRTAAAPATCCSPDASASCR